jgi:UDP-galactopyranose mutase
VGAGLFGVTCARLLTDRGQKCVVVDRRDHVAGNAYTELNDGINVHKYGAHIFHTKNALVWDYVNRYGDFNHYRHSVIANYRGKLFSLPFNMNTFYMMWGTVTPNEVKEKIERQKWRKETENLEYQALSLIGIDLYEKLVREYTEKQWGLNCKKLDPEIIKRLPIRFTYNSDYFDDPYQGIPVERYTKLVERVLEGIEVRLDCQYKDCGIKASKVIYTGAIDEYFEYVYGELEYRSLRFEEERIDSPNYQGIAVMNYTDSTPFTRIIEHKHFALYDNSPSTIITREYPVALEKGMEPYYPVNNVSSKERYEKYRDLASKEMRIHFGSRLGEYKYYNMDQVIESAMRLTASL